MSRGGNSWEGLDLSRPGGDAPESEDGESPSEGPESEDEEEARRRKRAAATRAQWERQGKVTRAQYSRLKTAVSAAAQDAIVELRREGYTRKQIVDHFRDGEERVTEYAVKRVLRIYAYDPTAFDAAGDDIVVLRK